MTNAGRAEQLQAEFNAHKRRSEERVRQARLKGRDETVEQLLDIIDDCDRALDQLRIAGSSGEATVRGVQRLRDRVIRHFARVGYEVFADEGDPFDPQLHEAIAVEAGDGIDGAILKVHRRGWRRHDGFVLRPAMVTVLRGSTERGSRTSISTLTDQLDQPSRPRRRRKPTTAENESETYTCPWSMPDCDGDCPGCSPTDDEGAV
jgi:molecular chaperone GrpE (heat shock protein)